MICRWAMDPWGECLLPASEEREGHPQGGLCMESADSLFFSLQLCFQKPPFPQCDEE